MNSNRHQPQDEPRPALDGPEEPDSGRSVASEGMRFSSAILRRVNSLGSLLEKFGMVGIGPR